MKVNWKLQTLTLAYLDSKTNYVQLRMKDNSPAQAAMMMLRNVKKVENHTVLSQQKAWTHA